MLSFLLLPLIVALSVHTLLYILMDKRVHASLRQERRPEAERPPATTTVATSAVKVDGPFRDGAPEAARISAAALLFWAYFHDDQ